MRSDKSKFKKKNNNKVSQLNDLLFTSQILLPGTLIIDIMDLHLDPEQRHTGNHLAVTWSGHDHRALFLESVCVTSIREKSPNKSHQ